MFHLHTAINRDINQPTNQPCPKTLCSTCRHYRPPSPGPLSLLLWFCVFRGPCRKMAGKCVLTSQWLLHVPPI